MEERARSSGPVGKAAGAIPIWPGSPSGRVAHADLGEWAFGAQDVLEIWVASGMQSGWRGETGRPGRSCARVGRIEHRCFVNLNSNERSRAVPAGWAPFSGGAVRLRHY